MFRFVMNLFVAVAFCICSGLPTINAATALIDKIFQFNNTEIGNHVLSTFLDENNSTSQENALAAPIYVTASGTIVEAQTQNFPPNFDSWNETSDTNRTHRKAPKKIIQLVDTVAKDQRDVRDDEYDDISVELLSSSFQPKYTDANLTTLTTPAQTQSNKTYSEFLKALSALANLPINYNGTTIIVTGGTISENKSATTTTSFDIKEATLSPSNSTHPAEMEEEEGEDDISDTSDITKAQERLKIDGVRNIMPFGPYGISFNPFISQQANTAFQPYGGQNLYGPVNGSGDRNESLLHTGQPYFATPNMNQLSPYINNYPINYPYNYNLQNPFQTANLYYNQGFSGFSPRDPSTYNQFPLPPASVSKETTDSRPTESKATGETDKVAIQSKIGFTSATQSLNPGYYYSQFPFAPVPLGQQPIIGQPAATSPENQHSVNIANSRRNQFGLFSLQDYDRGNNLVKATPGNPTSSAASTKESTITESTPLLPIHGIKESHDKVISAIKLATDTKNASYDSTREKTIIEDCEEWSSWAKCSQKCGGCGQKRRERACSTGLEIERKTCHMRACDYPEPACCEGREPRLVNSVMLCLLT